MPAYKLISADSHIVEPPDLYSSRIDARFRDRAPRMERRRTPAGREYDAWVINGMQVGTLGAVMQAGQRFEDPSQIDFLGVWTDVRKGAYDPQAMLAENEEDGVWGSCLQPSQGLFWYRIPDSELLTEICRAYNDWIAEFCKADPERLKGIAMLNVDDVAVGVRELERAKQLGLVGAFIPVSPLPERPYRDPVYDPLWAAAQDLSMPLLLHIATNRSGVPGCEFTMDVSELTGAGRSTTDHWVRYSLSAMVFAGVFDRFPRLKVGSVEHETAWIPHWLKQMDFTYRERPVFTKGWKSKEGMLPSDYWRRNMFVEFMEDDLGVELREHIGVDNMLWGSDYPHAESTWPRSRDFLDRILPG
jgi:predicted TIM-barrel fold metal-dependent hydrolase